MVALGTEENFIVPLSRLSSMDRLPLIILPKSWNNIYSLKLKTTPQKKYFQHIIEIVSYLYACCSF